MTSQGLAEVMWRKSSRSTASGGSCVEAALIPSGAEWRKSSRSASSGGSCVEAAPVRDEVAVRDSKDPDGPALTFTRAAWRSFTAALRGHGFGPR